MENQELIWVVYVHINKTNNKKYVGISCSPVKRWNNGNGYKNHKKFYNAIKKYGWDEFSHVILEEHLSFEEAKEREVYYIQKYDSFRNGYNCTEGGEGCVGYKHTEESKEKMSKSRIGRVINEEWRNNLSKSHKGKKKGKYNYSLSSEQKEHLSNKLKQYYQNHPEHRLNKKFSSKKIVKIECDGLIFDTIYDCAKYYGVDKSSMSSWLSGKSCVPQEFINKKLHKIGQDIEYEKVLLKNKNKIYCDKIEYESIKDCAKFYKIDPIIMKKWLNNPNKMPKKFKDLNLHKEPVYGYKLKNKNNNKGD